MSRIQRKIQKDVSHFLEVFKELRIDEGVDDDISTVNNVNIIISEALVSQMAIRISFHIDSKTTHLQKVDLVEYPIFKLGRLVDFTAAMSIKKPCLLTHSKEIANLSREKPAKGVAKVNWQRTNYSLIKDYLKRVQMTIDDGNIP